MAASHVGVISILTATIIVSDIIHHLASAVVSTAIEQNLSSVYQVHWTNKFSLQFHTETWFSSTYCTTSESFFKYL